MTYAKQATPSPRKPLLPFWSRLSLRAKLVVVLLMVAALPLTIAVLINGNSAREAALREADQKLLGASESLADQIGRALQAGLDSARYQAHLPVAVNYLLLPAERRADSPEEESLLDFMQTAARENPLYVTSMAVFDAQGKNLLDTSAAEVGISIAGRGYFQQAMTSGLPVASSVERDPVTDTPSLYFIAPIQNADDEIIGALRVRYDALMLQELIAQNKGRAGESSFAMLLDGNGIFLANGADTQSLYQPAGLPRFSRQTAFRAALHGETLQIALTPIENTSWVAAFAQPQAVILAPANAQTRVNLAVAFVLAVGVAFFGLLIAEGLAASIIRLTESKAALLEAQAAFEETKEEAAAPQAIPVLLEAPAAMEESVAAASVQVQTAVAAPPMAATAQKQAQVAAKTSPRKPRSIHASEDHLEVAIERLGMILRAAKVSADGETHRRENRP